jgi:hypothetical protein
MPDEGVCAVLQQKFCRIGVPVPASLKIDQKKRRNFRRKTVFKDQTASRIFKIQNIVL